MNRTRLTVIACLCAVLCAGGAIGYAVARKQFMAALPPQETPVVAKEDWLNTARERLASQLGLDAKQKVRSDEMLAGTAESILGERERSLFTIHLMMLRHHDALAAEPGLLNAEQREKILRAKSELKSRILTQFRSMIEQEPQSLLDL